MVFLTLNASLAQTLPSDPAAGCPIPPTTINGWFESGVASLDGVVKPADSVNFPDKPNCSFYEWSMQMFLWLTSPTPPSYGSTGGRVFQSAPFFDVSPQGSDGRREFIAHTSNLLRLSTFSRQRGPNKLPLIIDKAGRKFEVEPPSRPLDLPRIRNSLGRLTEVAEVTMGRDGVRRFADKTGRAIQPQFSIPRSTVLLGSESITNIPRVQRFLLNGISLFVDKFGNVIETEEGQADDSVLIAQKGSLVYYGISVNDVFAYFRTKQGNGAINGALRFPTTSSELNDIVTFASGHNRTIVDGEALAVEIKTSWVEDTEVQDPQNYLTTRATVPLYDKSNPNKWTVNGEKTVRLVLVGMHVVGSTKGHPEMVWATFEHVGNTPNAEYDYLRTTGGGSALATVAQNTSGTWLFCASGSMGPFNQLRNIMERDSMNRLTGNILAADSSRGIGPDNIIRWKSWGAPADVRPNPLKTAPQSNSELIAANNSVRTILDAADVRRNYLLTGATWTIGGTAPTGPSHISSGNEVGTDMLNNSTMETFSQGNDNKSPNTSNCFTCHAGNQVRVSHVFTDLKPLF